MLLLQTLRKWPALTIPPRQSLAFTATIQMLLSWHLHLDARITKRGETVMQCWKSRVWSWVLIEMSGTCGLNIHTGNAGVDGKTMTSKINNTDALEILKVHFPRHVTRNLLSLTVHVYWKSLGIHLLVSHRSVSSRAGAAAFTPVSQEPGARMTYGSDE